MTQIEAHIIDASTSAQGHIAAKPAAKPATAAAILAALLMMVAVAFYGGRLAQERAAQSEAAMVEQETREFCGSLGFTPQTERYQHCETGLDAIRKRQEQRFTDAAAGLL
jgi:hypothetical protein